MGTVAHRMKWRKESDLKALSDKGYVINKCVFSSFCIAYLPLINSENRRDVGSFSTVKEAVEACHTHYVSSLRNA